MAHHKGHLRAGGRSRPSNWRSQWLRHSFTIALTGLSLAFAPGCDSANEPHPGGSKEQSENEDSSGNSKQESEVVKLRNVYIVNGEVVPIDPKDDDPEPYAAESLELFNPEREMMSYLPELRSPVRCESCVCSNGTCICEGCTVET